MDYPSPEIYLHLADAFIQSDLLRILRSDSCYTYFCQYACSLGIEPATFANTMLYH